MKTQQAVVQYALTPMAVELREVPVPEIGPADVLLKVGAASVCGSGTSGRPNAFERLYT